MQVLIIELQFIQKITVDKASQETLEWKLRKVNIFIL